MNELLDVAVEVAGSDAASIQMYDEELRGLRLVGWQGFHPASAEFWQVVVPASASTCGMALVTGERVVVPDLEAEPAFADSDDLEEYRRSRLRAVQSTPLVAGDGRIVGMVSTHWRKPHEPSSARLRRIDGVARKCAAAVAEELERKRTVSRQYTRGFVNRGIADAVGRVDRSFREIIGTSGSATFFCACGREDCRWRALAIPIDVYERVRVSPHRFLIVPGHAADVDEIVERGESYEIVEVKPEYRLRIPAFERPARVGNGVPE